MPGLTDEHHDWFDRVLGVNTRPTQAADTGDAAGGGSAADGGGDETTLGQLLGGVTSGFEGVGAAFAGATEALIPPIEGGTDIAIDPTSQPYQAGYQDALAARNPDPGQLGGADLANYVQGWEDGTNQRITDEMPPQDAPQPAIDAGSEAYLAGFQDASQGRPQAPGPRDEAGLDNYNQGWRDGIAVKSGSEPSPAYNDAAYQEAASNGDWDNVAVALSQMSDAAIIKRLAQLDPDSIRRIHDAAVASPELGPNSEVALLTGGLNSPIDPNSEDYQAGFHDGFMDKPADFGDRDIPAIANYNQGWLDGSRKGKSAPVAESPSPSPSPSPAATPAGGRFRIRMFEGTVGADPSRDSRFTFALWDVENGLVAAYSLTGAVLRGRGPRAPGGGGGDWSKPFEPSRPLGLDQFGDHAELIEGNGGAWSIRLPAAGATAEVATALSEAYGIDSGAGTFTYLPGSVRKSTG